MGLLRSTADKYTEGRRKEAHGHRLPENHWNDGLKTVEEKIKPLFEAIRNEIQKLLGHEMLPMK
jgi:hypothetical protein